jgi:hypothetical protein
MISARARREKGSQRDRETESEAEGAGERARETEGRRRGRGGEGGGRGGETKQGKRERACAKTERKKQRRERERVKGGGKKKGVGGGKEERMVHQCLVTLQRFRDTARESLFNSGMDVRWRTTEQVGTLVERDINVAESSSTSSSSVAKKLRFRYKVLSEAPLLWKKVLSTFLTSFFMPATSFLSCETKQV